MARENFVDKHIALLTQDYPYTCEDTKLSITTQNSKTFLSTQHLKPFDYAKLALDMSIAFYSNPLGQINIVVLP